MSKKKTEFPGSLNVRKCLQFFSPSYFHRKFEAETILKLRLLVLHLLNKTLKCSFSENLYKNRLIQCILAQKRFIITHIGHVCDTY